MLEREFEEKKARIFSTLFNMEWNGKKIWEHIRDEKLTATPAFVGELYSHDDVRVKLMFVGRDLNGWDEEIGDCSSLENAVASILNQPGALETLVNEKGYDGYYHKNSKFFRFIKHILEDLGESDPGIENTFYHDFKRWNQRFIWANLYCIAPRRPKSMAEAHPDNGMVKQGIDEYVDLMQLYIEHYKPDVVVFITDVRGWFVRWTRKKSFKDIVSDYKEVVDHDTISATGFIGDSRIVVCKRPDRWGNSYAQVEAMATNIANWIKPDK